MMKEISIKSARNFTNMSIIKAFGYMPESKCFMDIVGTKTVPVKTDLYYTIAGKHSVVVIHALKLESSIINPPLPPNRNCVYNYVTGSKMKRSNGTSILSKEYKRLRIHLN